MTEEGRIEALVHSMQSNVGSWAVEKACEEVVAFEYDNLGVVTSNEQREQLHGIMYGWVRGLLVDTEVMELARHIGVQHPEPLVGQETS